jgi:hypothetical protein
MGKEQIKGWNVTRGITKVKLKDGKVGTIKEWYGGFITLDDGTETDRDQVVDFWDPIDDLILPDQLDEPEDQA